MSESAHRDVYSGASEGASYLQELKGASSDEKPLLRGIRNELRNEASAGLRNEVDAHRGHDATTAGAESSATKLTNDERCLTREHWQSINNVIAP